MFVRLFERPARSTEGSCRVHVSKLRMAGVRCCSRGIHISGLVPKSRPSGNAHAVSSTSAVQRICQGINIPKAVLLHGWVETATGIRKYVFIDSPEYLVFFAKALPRFDRSSVQIAETSQAARRTSCPPPSMMIPLLTIILILLRKSSWTRG